MFPTSEIGILLSFARGQSIWSIEVFDAALTVAGYFGRMLITQPKSYGGTANPENSDDIVSVLESVNVEAGLTDGHPVASLSPVLVSIILQYALKILLKNFSYSRE
jgi:hypothetical protein